MAYVRPQVEVFQEFTQAPNDVLQNLNAFIFGPNYQLFRYAEADERAQIGVGAYDKDAGNDVDYPNQPAGSTVDQDYVKVFAEDVLLRYAEYPADPGTPIVVASENQRNRLRAAPTIGDASVVTTGPTVETEGYHTGGVTLPESYYLFPQATFDVGTVDGVFDYITTEGNTGSFDVGDDATTAGVKTQGPDGIVLDFDVAGTAQAPLTITFLDDTADTFTLSAKVSRRAAHGDFSIAGNPLSVVINNAAGALAGSYDNVTHTLTLDIAPTDTLAAVRTELLSGLAAGQADFLVEFDVSALSGAGAGDAITASDQDANDLSAASADMIPVIYRIVVNENAIVFQTANGYSRSPELLRDVLVGDRIRWRVTSVGTGESEEVMAKVVGFAADRTDPLLSDAVENGNNQDTQTGNDASSGLSLVAAGDDNQRDFDGAGTAVFSLNGTSDFVHGDYTRGILDQALSVEITAGGVAGTAKATVTNAAGTYFRTDVPIEATGVNDGQIFLGNNLYINFEVGGGDADNVFQAGDVYTIDSITAPYAAVLGSSLTVAGEYAGFRDTTYTVQVLRGGVFDRVAFADNGLTSPASGAVTLELDLANWAGGDIDDEYILECTADGDVTTSRWSLRSQLGEVQANISFAGFGAGNQRSLGSKGLEGYLAGAGSFVAGEYFVATVRASRPSVRVTDTAGIDQQVTQIVNDGDTIALGINGGTLTIPANANTLSGLAPGGGLLLGERWTVEATASADGPIQTLIVSQDVFADAETGTDANGDSNANPDILAIDLFLVQNSSEIPGEQRDPAFAPGNFNWETDAEGVTVNDGITLQDASWVDGLGNMPWLPMWAGDLFVEYRALMTEYTNSIQALTDISQVTTELGTVHPDNPLAQGVYKALENSGAPAVYFMAVPSDDLEGYSRVLDRASLTTDVYGLAPMTMDPEIIGLVEGHIGNMSTETERKWRIGFVSAPTPTETAQVTAANKPGGDDWLATITDNPLVSGTQYTKVEFTEDAELLDRVVAGDIVRFNFATDAWGNQTYETAVVASVETDKILYLDADIGDEVSPAEKIEIYHPLNVQEIAEEVRDISGALSNRRLFHVFPGELGAFGTTLEGMYGAAAIAGLTSSVVPQQGLTNIAVNGFDDIPLVYSTFSQEQLDVIAGGGTLIIMQDQIGGQIYVRHQISTAYQDGNLLTAELSITKNFDSISYFLGNELDPYIGIYNVTPELVIQLETVVQSALNFLGSLTGAGLLGPQLILEGTEITNIQQHPVLKDRVLIYVTLNLPVPLNNIELHLVV